MVARPGPRTARRWHAPLVNQRAIRRHVRFAVVTSDVAYNQVLDDIAINELTIARAKRAQAVEAVPV